MGKIIIVLLAVIVLMAAIIYDQQVFIHQLTISAKTSQKAMAKKSAKIIKEEKARMQRHMTEWMKGMEAARTD